MTSPEWRYFAVHPLTGAMLVDDLPLSGVALTRRLSGPWELQAVLEPEYARLLTGSGRVLNEWAAAIWAEQDGRIRGGGLFTGSSIVGHRWQLTAEGYARYPFGIPYLGNYQAKNVDPLDAARHVWAHIQSYADGNLGVVLDPTTSPVRLGTGSSQVGFTTGAGAGVSFEAQEFYELRWWDTPDCGDEFDTLARETPFEYVEDHQWASDSSDTITHRLRLGYPQMGRRRTDIGFVEGENLTALPEMDRSGETFAQYVIGLGAGEGQTRLRTPQVGGMDGRVRRVAVMERGDVTDIARLNRLASAHQRATRHVGSIPGVVAMDHPNAPIGSWQLGDEVEVSLTAWGGGTEWCRITSETITPNALGMVALGLARADGL